MIHNLELKQNSNGFIEKMQNKADPQLFKNFVVYWAIRKSNPFLSANVVMQLKNSYSKVWIKLIEANHKFRTVYGEETAEELIKIIENGGLTKEVREFVGL